MKASGRPSTDTGFFRLSNSALDFYFGCGIVEYRTVKAYANTELEERRSRFIGYGQPVSSVDEAVSFIESIRRKHPDATHNVYAYRLKSGAEKYSDDGEPGGTAGLPIMSVLKIDELFDVCVVVTRYFGGILLGAGGLVRAYSKAAKEATQACGIIMMKPVKEVQITCDYNTYGKLQKLIERFEAEFKGAEFTDNVKATAFIDIRYISGFEDELNEISCGKAAFNIIGEAYRESR